MPKSPYASVGWRKVRELVLERDGRECRIRFPGCAGTADCVDHIVPISAGGRTLDPLNLRAACTHCNTVRANQGRGDDPRPLPRREW